jgi:hypothetical protein
MAQVARIDAELRTRLEDQAPTCSVLWLIGDGSAGDLGRAMSALGEGLRPAYCWASGCWSLAAARPRRLIDLTGREPVMTARIEFPDTAFVADLVPVGLDDAGVWDLFESGAVIQQLCAAMFRGSQDQPGQWADAATRLSVAAGVHRWMRLASAFDVEACLLDGFLAEVLTAGGVAITKIVPELLRAGIALTGMPGEIDRVEGVLAHLPRIDDLAVRRSCQLGGVWPR